MFGKVNFLNMPYICSKMTYMVKYDIYGHVWPYMEALIFLEYSSRRFFFSHQKNWSENVREHQIIVT